MERDVNIVIREVETVYILLSYNTVDWWPQWRKNPLAWISAVIWWSDCKYCWWRHDFIRGNRLPWHFYGEFEITIIHMPIMCGVFFLKEKKFLFHFKRIRSNFVGIYQAVVRKYNVSSQCWSLKERVDLEAQALIV